MRITKDILKNQIAILNRVSKSTYDLYFAYGKTQLVRLTEKGGQESVSGFCTTSEISAIISAITTYTQIEGRA